MKQIEKTNFIEIMGNCPRTRLIDFFIENKRDSWKLTELKKFVHINYDILKNEIQVLFEYNIIRYARRKQEYTLNQKNKISRQLVVLHNIINQFFIEQFLDQEK